MSGVYVYGIRERQRSLPKLAGVEPGTVVRAVAVGYLEALASPVRAPGPKEWERRCVNDLAWVRQAVLRHHAVIERVQQRETVLPLKFGSVVFRPSVRAAQQALQRAVAGHATAFRRLLQHLDGRAEYGVVLTVDETAFTSRVRRGRRAPRRQSAGRMWYHEQKEAARVRAVLDQATERALVQLVERLRPVVEAITAHDVPPAPAGRPTRRAALACLVARDQLPAFHRVLSEAGRALRRQGLGLECTGPWAPYHFLDLPPLVRSTQPTAGVKGARLGDF